MRKPFIIILTISFLGLACHFPYPNKYRQIVRTCKQFEKKYPPYLKLDSLIQNWDKLQKDSVRLVEGRCRCENLDYEWTPHFTIAPNRRQTRSIGYYLLHNEVQLYYEHPHVNLRKDTTYGFFGIDSNYHPFPLSAYPLTRLFYQKRGHKERLSILFENHRLSACVEYNQKTTDKYINFDERGEVNAIFEIERSNWVVTKVIYVKDSLSLQNCREFKEIDSTLRVRKRHKFKCYHFMTLELSKKNLETWQSKENTSIK